MSESRPESKGRGIVQHGRLPRPSVLFGALRLVGIAALVLVVSTTSIVGVAVWSTLSEI
jgi:hypothetical protein